jgi:uncharacterized membrane protein
MPNIHPLFVHFPIALIIMVFVFDLISVITRKKAMLTAAHILTAFAVAGAALSVITGLIAEESVWHPEAAHELLELHETVGIIILSLAVVLLIFRLALRDKLLGSLGWIAVLIGLAASALAGYTGYLGGEIVYKYGAGVQQAESATATADSLRAVIMGQNLEEAIEEEEEEEEEHHHDHDED